VKGIEDLRRLHGALEPERVIDALARAFAAWRAPDSLWRARLAREHRGFSAEAIHVGVMRALEAWDGDALARLRAREVPDDAVAPPVVAVSLAGSIPTAAFAAIALPLLGGSCAYVKCASADPVSPRLFADSLRAVDPEVAQAVAVGEDREAVERADAVVAYGRDETLAELRARIPIDRPFLAYGHKLSAAAVGRDAPLTESAEALALDAALWDGRGCLSPAFVFVEDEPAGRAASLAEALAEALGALERSLPRGPLSQAEQAWLHDLRAAFAVRDDARLLASRGTLAWTVISARFDDSPPFPGRLRALAVVPVRDLEVLADRCRGLAPHLSTLGHAGFGGRDPAGVLRAGGGSRLCPLGRMQLPPIDWHHDGRDAIRPLLRILDREPENGR
jgi:hypothetical protein